MTSINQDPGHDQLFSDDSLVRHSKQISFSSREAKLENSHWGNMRFRFSNALDNEALDNKEEKPFSNPDQKNENLVFLLLFLASVAIFLFNPIFISSPSVMFDSFQDDNDESQKSY